MASNLYKNALVNETRDLLELASNKQIPKPAFREAVIKQIIEIFSRQRSVLLVGAPGVDKTAITWGTGSRKSKADSIIKAAVKQRGVLYFTDIWNLPTAGISSKNHSNLLDALMPRVLSVSRLHSMHHTYRYWCMKCTLLTVWLNFVAYFSNKIIMFTARNLNFDLFAEFTF